MERPGLPSALATAPFPLSKPRALPQTPPSPVAGTALAWQMGPRYQVGCAWVKHACTVPPGVPPYRAAPALVMQYAAPTRPPGRRASNRLARGNDFLRDGAGPPSLLGPHPKRHTLQPAACTRPLLCVPSYAATHARLRRAAPQVMREAQIPEGAMHIPEESDLVEMVVVLDQTTAAQRLVAAASYGATLLAAGGLGAALAQAGGPQ